MYLIHDFLDIVTRLGHRVHPDPVVNKCAYKYIFCVIEPIINLPDDSVSIYL